MYLYIILISDFVDFNVCLWSIVNRDFNHERKSKHYVYKRYKKRRNNRTSD